jgi:ATP-dependent exoDNAse (exonuclease V) alpha subunit
MVTKNLKSGLVNGDLGTVRKIYPNSIVIESDRLGTVTVERAKWRKVAIIPDDVEGFKERETGSFSQFPLKLAYAVTVHKSQGQTYDRCHLELERQPFAHGLLYVALSRCRTLEGLTLGRRITWNDQCVDSAVHNWFRRPTLSGWGDL